MKNVIDIEEAVRVVFKVTPLLGNAKFFEQEIKSKFKEISWIGERIYVEIGEINFEECVIGVTYKYEGGYCNARITEVETFIEGQIEIFKTTIFA